MSKIKLETINRFLEPKKLAFAGVSRNEKKFGYKCFDDLLQKGFNVYPVNPKIDKINGHKCYSSIAEIPDDCKHVLIGTPNNATLDLVKDSISKEVEMIWILKGSYCEDSLKLAIEKGIEVISNECIFMFTNPVKGPHKFHRFLKKLFGGFPK